MSFLWRNSKCFRINLAKLNVSFDGCATWTRIEIYMIGRGISADEGWGSEWMDAAGMNVWSLGQFLYNQSSAGMQRGWTKGRYSIALSDLVIEKYLTSCCNCSCYRLAMGWRDGAGRPAILPSTLCIGKETPYLSGSLSIMLNCTLCRKCLFQHYQLKTIKKKAAFVFFSL